MGGGALLAFVVGCRFGAFSQPESYLTDPFSVTGGVPTSSSYESWQTPALALLEPVGPAAGYAPGPAA